MNNLIQHKESILVPRNLQGRQEKLRQKTIKLLQQETIDGELILEKYMLDIPSDLIKVKTINGDLWCNDLELTELPKWFAQLTINGSFNCPYNNLTTLKNCPQIINRNFNCSYNILVSLKGCPQIINSSFNCSNNRLTTLEGCPQNINISFDCSNNQLTSLDHGPKVVKNNYYCCNNIIVLERPKYCKIYSNFIN